MKFLWITDPWDTLDHARDTTLRLATEAITLGHDSYWCDVRSIRWEDGKIRCDVAQIEDASFKLGFTRVREPREFRSIHYRVDPPVDLSYQHPLHLLRIALEGQQRRARLVNPLEALLLANEKLEACLLPGLVPASVVSSQWSVLKAFGEREHRTVLKPLELAQSKGIELLDWDNQGGHARDLLTVATANFTRPVLLQHYLPGIKTEGETRLWFLDGKVLASAKKLPLENDFRVNIDRGSQLAPHPKLSAREKKASLAIAKRLRALGVRLAAVDLIDGYVTDFNVTSPGLLIQMEKLSGQNLAKKIITALAKTR